MSQITKVTSFLKHDLPELHKLADETHQMGVAVKSQAATIMSHVKGELEATQKELAELQAALGLTTNGPPVEDPTPPAGETGP